MFFRYLAGKKGPGLTIEDVNGLRTAQIARHAGVYDMEREDSEPSRMQMLRLSKLVIERGVGMPVIPIWRRPAS